MQQNQITKIESMHNQGIRTCKIAEELGLSHQLVNYYINRKDYIKRQVESFKRKPLKERQRIYKQRLKYLVEYQRKRYKEDQNFRELAKQRSKKFYKSRHNRYLKTPNN